MEKFYILTRSSTNELYFIRKDGYRVQNDYGLDLFVYKSNETFEANKFWWYVVEGRTGMSLANGTTKSEAVLNALIMIPQQGVDAIKARIEKSEKLYGTSPLFRATYL